MHKMIVFVMYIVFLILVLVHFETFPKHGTIVLETYMKNLPYTVMVVGGAICIMVSLGILKILSWNYIIMSILILICALFYCTLLVIGLFYRPY